jgi:GH43 family beta-xylosidase
VRTKRIAALAALFAVVAACGTSSPSDGPVSPVSGDADASADASAFADANAGADADADANELGDAAADAGVDAGGPCTTRIGYGDTWIRPGSHPNDYDDVAGIVTWDGACTDDGANSYALLSNGFKPYFTGHGACVIALDQRGACPSPPPSCKTRLGYGAAWLPPPNHPNAYDDVAGRVFSDRVCHDSGANSYEQLSNGFQPTFTGNGACEVSFEYVQCGGLYRNPVIPLDCPDPGVVYDGVKYVLSCTSGDAADAFPIYVSDDLASWTLVGHVFPKGSAPAWAQKDFWAPEIHRVGTQWVVYFSARGADGMLAIGAASSASSTGPFTALTTPLIHDASVGLIDASEIDAAGTPYVLWKEDGNAIGNPTPIHAQPLAANGLALTGSPSTLITNDQAWEGPLVEAPFMVAHGGAYYLFYSGNGYATASYAVGVAKASSPTGPFTKASGPILVSGGAWAGPGHCAVLDTKSGDTAMVFHAWKSTAINAPPGRQVLVDAVRWDSPYPAVPFAPSAAARPVP